MSTTGEGASSREAMSAMCIILAAWKHCTLQSLDCRKQGQIDQDASHGKMCHADWAMSDHSQLQEGPRSRVDQQQALSSGGDCWVGLASTPAAHLSAALQVWQRGTPPRPCAWWACFAWMQSRELHQETAMTHHPAIRVSISKQEMTGRQARRCRIEPLQ